MPPVLAFIVVGVLAVFVLVPVFRAAVKRHRRQQILKQPLSLAYQQILRDRVPLYMALPGPLREQLEGAVNYFLYDKVFVGCNDFIITDEVRLTIAANACMMIIGRDKRYFPGFETILVYPEAFQAPQVSYNGLVETHHHSG